MNKSTRLIIFVILISLLFSNLCCGQNIIGDVKSAVLMDAKTGQILFSKNSTQELPPASLTKIMTILVALDEVNKGEFELTDKVKISSEAEKMGGSQIWLSAGEEVMLKDLLKAALVPSANDACVAIAEYIGGTTKNFVEMMNYKARALGLTQTHFINSTGLPNKKHFSTAHDLAVISQELIANYKSALKWSSIQVGRIKNKEKLIFTTNKLLGRYPGADGLQTGWTEDAGYCLVGTAKREDRRLISVILGAKSEQARIKETSRLLDYGFEVFDKVKLLKKGTQIKKVPIKGGEKLKVPVKTTADFSALVKQGTREQIKQEVKISKKLTAPLKKGEPVGKLVLTHPDYKVGEVTLVAAEKVERAGFFTLLFRWLESFIMDSLK